MRQTPVAKSPRQALARSTRLFKNPHPNRLEARESLAAGARIRRMARRALDRLRGGLNIDRLVAEGLELGRDVSIARNVYLDPGRPWLISIGDGSVLAPFVVVL